MRSPFLLASCGCIVLPLDRKSEGMEGYLDAICLWSCDSHERDSSWCFSVRHYEEHKLVTVATPKAIKHYEANPQPRLLTPNEEKRLIDGINLLMSMGDQARQANSILTNIGRQAQSQLLGCKPTEK